MIKESTLELLEYHSVWGPDGNKHITLIGLIDSPDFIDANEAAYFLDILQLVNIEVNGHTPSQTVNLHINELPRRLVYIISEIRDSCWDKFVYTKDIKCRRAIYTVVRWIDVCWGWILDGDIDDLVQELNDVIPGIIYEELIRLELVSDTELGG